MFIALNLYKYINVKPVLNNSLKNGSLTKLQCFPVLQCIFHS